MDRTIQHINKFATDGLRTMAVAVKTLSNEEYEYFSQAFYKAKNSLEDREAKLHKVYENLESNLELIGAIGIEDRLQENVRDTLINLSKAGILDFNSQQVYDETSYLNVPMLFLGTFSDNRQKIHRH